MSDQTTDQTTDASSSSTAGPTPWSLGGEPPEPQKIETIDPDRLVEIQKDLRPGDTHTGTDPLGRAIGPREDHLKVKRVRDDAGEIVTPKAKGVSTSQVEARARKAAEQTDTKREADDDPATYSPSQVAKAHAADAVLPPLDDTEA